MKSESIEMYVRNAFGGVDRGGDPAREANAMLFDSTVAGGVNLDKAKIVIGYATIIYNDEICDRCNGNLDDTEDREYMSNTISNIVNSKDYRELESILEQYCTYREKVLKTKAWKKDGMILRPQVW